MSKVEMMKRKEEQRLSWWQQTVSQSPGSLRKRIWVSAMAGTGLGLITFTLFSGLRYTLHGDGFGSFPGWIMVGLSMAVVPTMILAARNVDHARKAYALLAISGAPGSLAFLDAGLRLFGNWAGPDTRMWVSLLMIIGVFFIPILASYDARRNLTRLKEKRRQWLALHNRRGGWDPIANGQRTREFNQRPPLIARLLLMIAPALGLNIRRIFGQDIALAIAALFGAFFPYWLIYISISVGLSRVLFLARLERELKRPILLVEEG
jgi:hypothetical protein